MTGVVAVHLDDAPWTSFDIPGGSAPVDIAVLRDELDTRARTMFVRFPAGWRRDEPGSYTSAESLLILDGTLEMNGLGYGPRRWAYVPASTLRRDTATPQGATALARFGGPARWVRAEGKPQAPHSEPLEPIGSVASPFGRGRGRPLRSSSHGAAWLIDPPPSGIRARTATELFDLETRTWWWVPAGEPLPTTAGLCFCRTFHTEGGGS